MIYICISAHGNIVRIEADEDGCDSKVCRSVGGDVTFLLFFRTIEGEKKHVARIPADWAIVEEPAYRESEEQVAQRRRRVYLGLDKSVEIGGR